MIILIAPSFFGQVSITAVVVAAAAAATAAAQEWAAHGQAARLPLRRRGRRGRQWGADAGGDESRMAVRKGWEWGSRAFRTQCVLWAWSRDAATLVPSTTTMEGGPNALPLAAGGAWPSERFGRLLLVCRLRTVDGRLPRVCCRAYDAARLRARLDHAARSFSGLFVGRRPALSPWPRSSSPRRGQLGVASLRGHSDVQGSHAREAGCARVVCTHARRG